MYENIPVVKVTNAKPRGATSETQREVGMLFDPAEV